MPKYALRFDQDLCVGCQACEVACKQEHGIPVGLKWLQVVEIGPRQVGEKLKLDFRLLRCMHCGKPPCRDICPVQAIYKRGDGLVLIDEELCIGCEECIEACPFEVPQLNNESNVVEWCNMCVHRIEQGLQPSCVQHCPTEAIQFGDINILTQTARRKRAESRI